MTINNPAKRLAMKIISAVTFLLVFAGFMQSPNPYADRERPPPE